MYNLRVKAKRCGTIPFQGQVNGESNLFDLRQALFAVTSIPVQKQKILIGFPPHQIIGRDEDKLKSLGIKNGEVIIVEERALAPCNSTAMAASQRHDMDSYGYSPLDFPRGSLVKKVVPSDNSCLFRSVYYLVNGGDVIENNLQSMRETVAQAISQQPEVYNEAVLEKSNQEYCHWILQDTSWGGAIELSIFTKYYQIEIVVLNAKLGVVNRFGEDENYAQRIFLMYDGIHYDPLYLETYDGRHLYMIPSSEDWLLDQAYTLVQEAKLSGDYTDTNKFCLICKVCGLNMFGQQEAVRHAKETDHFSFSEVRRNT